MRHLGLAVLLIVSALGNVVRADDATVAITGKRVCIKDTQGVFSLSLVRKHNLNLLTQTLNGKKILMIVHYKTDKDECLDVLDAATITSDEREFEFQCNDPVHPGNIVVGEVPSQHWRIFKTQKAWRVDLSRMKIVPYQARVICENIGYAGEDDGSDLASEVRKRALSRGQRAKP